jgi:hypothetical protein
VSCTAQGIRFAVSDAEEHTTDSILGCENFKAMLWWLAANLWSPQWQQGF